MQYTSLFTALSFMLAAPTFAERVKPSLEQCRYEGVLPTYPYRAETFWLSYNKSEQEVPFGFAASLSLKLVLNGDLRAISGRFSHLARDSWKTESTEVKASAEKGEDLEFSLEDEAGRVAKVHCETIQTNYAI